MACREKKKEGVNVLDFAAIFIVLGFALVVLELVLTHHYYYHYGRGRMSV